MMFGENKIQKKKKKPGGGINLFVEKKFEP